MLRRIRDRFSGQEEKEDEIYKSIIEVEHDLSRELVKLTQAYGNRQRTIRAEEIFGVIFTGKPKVVGFRSTTTYYAIQFLPATKVEIRDYRVYVG